MTPREHWSTRLRSWFSVASPCLVVVGIGGVLTAVATHLVARSQTAAELQRFEKLVTSATDEVQARVNLYQYGVRGARGLFTASNSVERSEFRTYFESRDNTGEFPGALGVGYIHRVARSGLGAYVEAMRADGAPDFAVRTEGSAEDLYVIQFIEPYADSGSSRGYDIGSDPVRRAAAEQAMRTGRGTITARIELIQRQGQTGFLYFMPVYRRGSHPETPEERERDLVGWTYMPLVASLVLDGVCARVDGLVEFSAYDGSAEDPRHLLRDGLAQMGGTPSALEKAVVVEIADRVWTLHFASTPKFESSAGLSQTAVAALGGTVSTALLALLAWSIASRERRAVALTLVRTRELEAARLHAENATRVKASFLANMSHELRTPMTAILGFATVLQESGLAEDERARHVRTISRNGEHLLSILNDILDSAKLDAGSMITERIPCSPRAILQDVLVLLSHKAMERGLELSLEESAEMPASITTDPTRWKQILLNVVGNAIKFTESGTVRMRGRLVTDSADSSFRFVVEIQDTGIGMSDKQRAILFQPFRQADDSTTRRFGGTGLGLTISKSFAEMLGGGIEVESEVGRGSTFRVTIAAGRVELTAPPPLARNTDAPAQEAVCLAGRILLAEDGRDNQLLIARVLRKAGATVDIADDGAKAVMVAWAAQEAGQPFGLVLMDMHMPNMDGRTATRALRARGYEGPIVALTASVMSEEREACFEAGCDDFASKPLQPAELLALCQRFLRPVLSP